MPYGRLLGVTGNFLVERVHRLVVEERRIARRQLDGDRVSHDAELLLSPGALVSFGKQIIEFLDLGAEQLDVHVLVHRMEKAFSVRESESLNGWLRHDDLLSVVNYS